MQNLRKIPIACQLVQEICEELGIIVWIEPDYGYVGYIESPSGKRHIFKNTNFNVNPLGSIEICKDKEYSTLFLKKFGYLVPEGEVFFGERLNKNLEKKKTIHDGLIYAEKIGYPLIIKPNNLSQGVGVHKISNAREYHMVVKSILEKTQVFRIEKYYEGSDYRVVVFDNKIISAYQRIPLSIIGNGKNTISELIHEKQEYFNNSLRDTQIQKDDPRIFMKLQKQGYNFSSIIEYGKQVFLLDNANLSTGGESIDITETLHTDFKDIAIGATKDMGLRLCGVDFIAKDLTKPLLYNDNKYIILEINGAPGLDNYQSTGEKQRKYVKDLYKDILLSLLKEE